MLGTEWRNLMDKKTAGAAGPNQAEGQAAGVIPERVTVPVARGLPLMASFNHTAGCRSDPAVRLLSAKEASDRRCPPTTTAWRVEWFMCRCGLREGNRVDPTDPKSVAPVRRGLSLVPGHQDSGREHMAANGSIPTCQPRGGNQRTLRRCSPSGMMTA